MGTLEFDFEVYLPEVISRLDGSAAAEAASANTFRGDPKHRTIVCRHWLLGLCQNGATCSYLHRLDRSKMPLCKHGKFCKIKNCPLKHTEEQLVTECIFYKQGFCYNGPNCTRKHAKLSPDECPKEASFEPAVSSTTTATAGGAGGAVGPAAKKRKGPQNENYKVSLCHHWLVDLVCQFNEDCIFAHGEDEINTNYLSNEALNDSEVYDPTRGRMDNALELPYPVESTRMAFFVFQAPDLRSLVVSRRRGVWSIPLRLVDEINAALRSNEHVIIYFLCRALKGLYGVARLPAPIPPSMNMMSSMSPEFPIEWMRCLRIPMKTIAQLKIGSTGMFVGRSTADFRFDSKVGSEMLYISYRKPAWDWGQEIENAEQSLNRTPEELSFIVQDQLFSQSWVEKQCSTGGGMSDRRSGGNGGGAPFGAAPSIPPAPLKDFYTLDFPGFVFAAMTHVIDEMIGRLLFGLPAHMKTANIQPGAPLFILDENTGLILGIFKAATALTENIDATAFQGMLPMQVRVEVVVEAPQVHVHEPDYLGIFPQGPMVGPIGLRETKLLSNVMAVRAGVIGMPMGPGFGGVPDPSSAFSGGVGMYKPQFKNVDVVYIDINASPFDIKKRLLGINAATVLQIATEVGGSSRAVRIRMRGIGSGYQEGLMQQELPQPLHFNVCAETEDLLVKAVEKVKALVAAGKADLER